MTRKLVCAAIAAALLAPVPALAGDLTPVGYYEDGPYYDYVPVRKKRFHKRFHHKKFIVERPLIVRKKKVVVIERPIIVEKRVVVERPVIIKKRYAKRFYGKHFDDDYFDDGYRKHFDDDDIDFDYRGYGPY